jgi:hypothetical protein
MCWTSHPVGVSILLVMCMIQKLMMLASTQKTSLIKKVNSILIQAATSFWRKELLFHFSTSLYMQASMPERHRGGWGLLHPEHIL